jgi:hypothetical protein
MCGVWARDQQTGVWFFGRDGRFEPVPLDEDYVQMGPQGVVARLADGGGFSIVAPE